MKKQILIIVIAIISIILLSILLAMFRSKPATNSPTTPSQPSPQEGSKRDPELFKRVEDFQKQNHPDVFLTNKLPYETASFSITSNFVKASPSGHFHFTISSKGNMASAKNEFIAWLQSLGLTAQQINTLDVTYK